MSAKGASRCNPAPHALPRAATRAIVEDVGGSDLMADGLLLVGIGGAAAVLIRLLTNGGENEGDENGEISDGAAFAIATLIAGVVIAILMGAGTH